MTNPAPVIRRPKPTIADLTPKDIRLLSRAYSLQEEEFLCFGKNYFRLQELGLISDDNKITFVGRALIWKLSQEIKAKKEIQ